MVKGLSDKFILKRCQIVYDDEQLFDDTVMQLEKILQSQGFGSRKESRAIIAQGLVSVHGQIIQNPAEDFSTDNFTFNVNGQNYTFYFQIYMALNKPTGYECTQNSSHHHSVFELIPEPMQMRSVQLVGRLDQDTTGLLLLSDDGQFIQALTHPRRHVAKRYRVTTAQPLTPDEIERLTYGVMLKGEKGVFKGSDVVQTDTHEVIFSIHQGLYHQVKRMVAAAGNHVNALERIEIGQLSLASLNLPLGQWCILTPQQQQAARFHSLST